MEICNLFTTLRNKRSWSQTHLAAKSSVSPDISGKYELGEAVPSIEAARNTVKDLHDIQYSDANEKENIFAMPDAFLAKNKLQAFLK